MTTATPWYGSALAALPYSTDSGRWRIAELMVTAGRWMSRAEIASTVGISGTAVAGVAMELRRAGVAVEYHRDHRTGQAMYFVPVPERVAA